MIVGNLYLSSMGIFIPLTEADLYGDRLYLRLSPNTIGNINGSYYPFFNSKNPEGFLNKTFMIENMISEKKLFLQVMNDDDPTFLELENPANIEKSGGISIGDNYQYKNDKKTYKIVMFTQSLLKYLGEQKIVFHALGLNIEGLVFIIKHNESNGKTIKDIVPEYEMNSIIYSSIFFKLLDKLSDLTYWSVEEETPANVIITKQKREPRLINQNPLLDRKDVQNIFSYLNFLLDDEIDDEFMKYLSNLPWDKIHKLKDKSPEAFELFKSSLKAIYDEYRAEKGLAPSPSIKEPKKAKETSVKITEIKTKVELPTEKKQKKEKLASKYEELDLDF
jgi:hypothetical protein